MNEEFKIVKSHLNFLNENFNNKLDIMYIGMFCEKQFNYIIGLYLPKPDYIMEDIKLFSEQIAMLDSFDINLKYSTEVHLIDIRHLNKYKNSGNIKSLFRSPYRIINKKYKSYILEIINNLNFFIESKILDLVRQYIKDEEDWVNKWNKNAAITVNLNDYIKKYENIYVTSDLHLFHKNILKYEENRLQFLGIDRDNYYLNLYSKYGQQYCVSKLVEHDKELIRNYNHVVGKSDLCFILGDLSFGKAKETEEALKLMHGDKILLVGNHDTFLKDKSFDNSLFLGIFNYLEINVNGQGIVLSHYPILHFKKQEYDKGNIHLYGHTHAAKIYKPYHSFHVGVDANEYAPVPIQYAIEQAKLEETNKPRYINKEVE